MAWVSARANEYAAKHVDTRKAVKAERDKVSRRAEKNLAAANTTSRITLEGYFPASIDEDEDGALVDFYTILTAPNAVALEFGHAPSGFFAGTNTKAPAATYILTRAAIGGTVS